MSQEELYDLICRLLERGEPFAVATVITARGSIPNEVGAKMVVGGGGLLLGGTIGGGKIEQQILHEAGEALAGGQSRVSRARLCPEEAGGIGMMCGGELEVFIEVIQARPQLVLCGAGHINLRLAAMAHELGWRVTVIDDRTDWANAENYPHAAVINGLPEQELPRLKIGAGAAIVIGTRDRDKRALIAASNTPAGYIGVVASRLKGINLLKEAAAELDLERLLPRYHAPVGLDLGGRAPEAVALSILAELQAWRFGRDARPLTLPPERLNQYFATHPPAAASDAAAAAERERRSR